MVKRCLIFCLIAFTMLFCGTACFAQSNNEMDRNIQRQIQERLEKYRASLQQRAAQFSPRLRQAIQTQCQKTIQSGSAKLETQKYFSPEDYQITLRRVLPTWESQCFLAKHCPFSGTPDCNEYDFVVPVALLVQTISLPKVEVSGGRRFIAPLVGHFNAFSFSPYLAVKSCIVLRC